MDLGLDLREPESGQEGFSGCPRAGDQRMQRGMALGRVEIDERGQQGRSDARRLTAGSMTILMKRTWFCGRSRKRSQAAAETGPI